MAFKISDLNHEEYKNLKGIDMSLEVKPPYVNELICPICLQICVNPVCAPCEHLFCREHIDQFLQRNSFCPICRQKISRHELKPPPRRVQALFESLKYYCNNCNTTLKANRSELHEAGCSGIDSQPIQKLFDQYNYYVNCDANTILYGEKLSTIISLICREILCIDDSRDTENKYKNLCQALEKKLGSYEPHERSLRLVPSDKNTVIKNMKSFVQKDMEWTNRLIECTAEKLFENFNIFPIQNLGNIFYCMIDNSFTISEFMLLKIFRSGEFLELILCYMEVDVRDKNKRVLFISWKDEQELFMKYQQKKFTLSKFDIKKIIKKVLAGY